MRNLSEWLDNFTNEMLHNFPDNICCIGLQGSYGRGEVSADSDLDLVVIFKSFSLEVLQQYKSLLLRLGNDYKLCGFVGSAEILKSWNEGELLQLYFDTVPVYGNLDFIKDRVTDKPAAKLVLQNSCLIYHACCHNFLFDEEQAILKELYKTAVFTVQAKYYYVHHVYVSKHSELSNVAIGADKEILETAVKLKMVDKFTAEQLTAYSDLLLQWSSNNIIAYGKK